MEFMPTRLPPGLDIFYNISFIVILDSTKKNKTMNMSNHAQTSNSEYDRVKQLRKI